MKTRILLALPFLLLFFSGCYTQVTDKDRSDYYSRYDSDEKNNDRDNSDQQYQDEENYNNDNSNDSVVNNYYEYPGYRRFYRTYYPGYSFEFYGGTGFWYDPYGYSCIPCINWWWTPNYYSSYWWWDAPHHWGNWYDHHWWKDRRNIVYRDRNSSILRNNFGVRRFENTSRSRDYVSSLTSTRNRENQRGILRDNKTGVNDRTMRNRDIQTNTRNNGTLERQRSTGNTNRTDVRSNNNNPRQREVKKDQQRNNERKNQKQYSYPPLNRNPKIDRQSGTKNDAPRTYNAPRSNTSPRTYSTPRSNTNSGNRNSGAPNNNSGRNNGNSGSRDNGSNRDRR